MPSPCSRRISLFGRPAASVDGSRLALPEKALVLVAILAFAEGRELDRGTVRELLWGEAEAKRQAGNLRQLLLRLDRLGADSPIGVAAGGRLRLLTPLWQVDAVELLATDPAVAPARMAAAGGVLLEGVGTGGEAFEDWLGSARGRADAGRGAILRARLGDRELDPAEAVRLAEALIALDPADEDGYRRLMRMEAVAGRREAARRWWLECRSRLKEAGGEPSPETSRLAMELGFESMFAAPREAGRVLLEDILGAPTVVIMPPAVLAGTELLDRFGLVLLEEVTLGLSQFGSFRVIAAHTSWQLAKRGGEMPQLPGTRLDYAVSVGVRSGGDPLGATFRLTRLSTGEVLWSVETEVSADNLQSSLNDIVRRTVGSLAAAIERSEGRISVQEAGSSGYRMYLEGKRSVGTTGLESLRAARKWFRLAVRRCDEFSAAFAGLSRTLSMEWLVRGMTDRDLLADALRAAEQARACDPGSGRALREIGFVNLYLRRHDESLAHFAEARSLAPSDADLLADYADVLLHDGQHDKASELMRAAKRLNPLGPDYYRWIEASILYQTEDYEGAVEILRPIEHTPATARLLAASCAMAGDLGRARFHGARVRENYPDFRIEQIWKIVPDRSSVQMDRYAVGLRLAGLD